MGRLEGRTIVVTGAARGLGRAMLRCFVEEGAYVVAAARDPARIAAAAAEFNDKAVAWSGDLSQADEIERLFDTVKARFGKLHALINNAAIYDFFKFEEVAADRIRNTVDTNLLGPILCARAAIPLLREAGGGDIINITSVSVNNPLPFLNGYAATKAALENFSRGLRTELRPENIRVTALRVGGMGGPEREVYAAPDQEEFMKTAGKADVVSGTTLIPFKTVAAAAADILALEAGTTYDFVEMRPTI